MAAPRHFPEATTELGAPPDSEDVAPLPVRRIDGTLVSCWQFTADEIEQIRRTGCIWLSIWGRVTQPPVMITAFKHDVI